MPSVSFVLSPPANPVVHREQRPEIGFRCPRRPQRRDRLRSVRNAEKEASIRFCAISQLSREPNRRDRRAMSTKTKTNDSRYVRSLIDSQLLPWPGTQRQAPVRRTCARRTSWLFFVEGGNGGRFLIDEDDGDERRRRRRVVVTDSFFLDAEPSLLSTLSLSTLSLFRPLSASWRSVPLSSNKKRKRTEAFYKTFCWDFCVLVLFIPLSRHQFFVSLCFSSSSASRSLLSTAAP